MTFRTQRPSGNLRRSARQGEQVQHAVATTLAALRYPHRAGPATRVTMSAQVVELERVFPFPVERLFAHLSEHENLGPLFGARIRRVRDGDSERNGVGSVRSLRVGPGAPFEETVTVFEPNARIEYRITRGSPLKNHHGCMIFTREGDGSRLHYKIVFEGRLPIIGPVVRFGLQRSLERALSKLAL